MADTETAPAGGEVTPSFADDLAKTWDEMEKADAPPAETAAAEPVVETETPKGDRARGPDGKFIKADGAPETAAPAEPVTDQGVKPAIEPAATQAIEPPVSWSAASKAKWNALPPDIQQEVLKREGDFTKGLDQRATRLKTFEPIEHALEPVRQHLELSGVSPAAYVGQLVAVDKFLKTNAPEAIKWLAQQVGVDLQKLTADQPPVDPQLAPLQAEIQGLKQTLTTYEQQQKAAAEAAIFNQIDSFKSQADAQGQPKHPHFETVRVEMGALMNAGRARGEDVTMEKAYEMAVWARPDLRQSLLSAQQAAAETKRQADAKAKAVSASKAAGLDVSGKGSGSAPKPKTLVEDLSDTWDRLAS